MKRILIIGAGRSATSAIEYFSDQAKSEDWNITVADFNLDLAQRKLKDLPKGRAIKFDVFDKDQRVKEIKRADMVVSLLPPHMHVMVAKDCVRYKTSLVTASYVSEEMKALDEPAKAAGITLLNEMGLDPGIDHMSAMEVIDRIHEVGGKLISFRSHCGALVAPQSDNMWGYKFTWAPRNVILAGKGMARYLQDGTEKYVPYNRLFSHLETISVPGYGNFESYANRDSFKYQKPYDLEKIPTLLRGTLRQPGFCRLWNAIIQIGLTDDSLEVENSEDMTWRDFTMSFIPETEGLSDAENLAQVVGAKVGSEIMDKLLKLGLLSEEKIELKDATPAVLLQNLLEKKWEFTRQDVDMVVMQHQFTYNLKGQTRKIVSSMVYEGKGFENTAISITVGLPAAIGAKNILQGKVPQTGVIIPVDKEVYQPVLSELANYGIEFTDQRFVLEGDSWKLVEEFD